MSTRPVVQVLDAEGRKHYGLFFAIHAARTQASVPEVRFVETPEGVPSAVRTWWYPGARIGYEFVHPKAGNAAIAGHRDTFFRPLRRVRVGDEVRLTSPRGRVRSRVTAREVVDPDAVHVLDPSRGALTLLTCHPFDFIGPAPKRFVVHAERMESSSG